MRRAPFAAPALALVVAAAPALAAPPAWTVDKTASRLSFSSVFAGQAVRGVFRSWDAQIQFDPRDLAASRAVVTIDVASAKTGDADKDQALPTADWFDAKRFPRASFTATGFKDLGAGRYQATGELILHGVKRPIVLPFTLAITGERAKMSGQAVVARNLFGVGRGQFASAETVPFNVAVGVQLTARRAQ
jgi:polyisoprenoid-binding protein YceI